jgi:5'(3')-deoxyribonucleotidase
MGSRPIIAIDCDGVLTDNFGVWGNHFQRQKCGKLHAGKPEKYTWDAWEDICKDCWHDVIHDREIMLSHELKPGVVHALDFLSSIADLHLITSRPESTGETTSEWLFWQDIYSYFKGVHLCHNKRELCDKLGVIALLDDGPHNLLALKGSNTIPVIFDADYNKHIEGIRVHNWKEAYIKLGIIILENSLDMPNDT